MNTNNNFDNVRIALALIVVFAHIAALANRPEFAEFKNFFDSNFAVKGFFAISGFLVTRSYLNSHSLIDYAVKRVRRIYPPYLLVVFLCYLLGLAFTSLELVEFLTSPISKSYLFYNLVFLNFLQPSLPGVFLENPIHAVNGSLWTIKIEVLLYIVVPPLTFLWARKKSIFIAFFLVLLSVVWVVYFKYYYTGAYGEEISRQFPGQMSFFIVGSYFSMSERCRSQIKYIGPISLAFLFCEVQDPLKTIIEPFVYAPFVIWICTIKKQFFNFAKYGDLSYGIYLYHFPIIQALVSLRFFYSDPWLALLLVLFTTIFCAWVSWHFIEKKLCRSSR